VVRVFLARIRDIWKLREYDVMGVAMGGSMGGYETNYYGYERTQLTLGFNLHRYYEETGWDVLEYSPFAMETITSIIPPILTPIMMSFGTVLTWSIDIWKPKRVNIYVNSIYNENSNAGIEIELKKPVWKEIEYRFFSGKRLMAVARMERLSDNIGSTTNLLPVLPATSL